MQYNRPPEILAGFHASAPDEALPELLFLGEHWSPRSYRIALHTHATWELYFQVSGQCRWQYADDLYTLNPGDFFAVAPHVPHCLYEPPLKAHHYMYAAIDLMGVFDRHPTLARHWQEKATVFLPRSERVLATFRQLIREVTAQVPYRTLGIRSALDYLVLDASRLIIEQANLQSKGISPLSIHPAVLRARDLIDYQPGAHWRLTDLARMVNLSPQYLVECFHRDIGVSPHQYILQARITHAKELLASSNRSITDLAFDLGFSSSQHFAMTFKRLTGHTPHAYRKQGK